MQRTRWTCGIFAALASTLAAAAAQAVLDRPPEILELRQVGDVVRLMWAPGGDVDGTLNENVVSYTVQRTGLGVSGWTTIFNGDQHAMTHVDSIADSATWTGHQGGSVQYRVEAATTSDTTLSATASLVPSLPVWIDEALEGKARMSWVPSTVPHPSYPVHLGYKVQKLVSGSWTDLTGYLTDLSYVDPATTIGVRRYRVQSVYQKNGNSSVSTLISNEVEIDLQIACEGQIANPAVPPLTVIEIGDRDSDLGYDGDDIVDALEECATIAYEDLGGAGDGDGVCEPANGETCITGGCILRALPVTYDDVAIRITNRTQCDASPTHPLDCLPLDFPAGLVIEGHGRQTVFRSPLWQSVGTPVPFPAPVLEVHRRDFQVTLRNLVLDGRKFEQEPPGTGIWSSWWYGGLYVWNTGPWLDQVREIVGDSIGDEDGYCDPERCIEAASGNDGDGQCDPGEDCLEHPQDVGIDTDNICSTDVWTNAPGCESTKDADDGCIHNVEVRDIPGAHAVMISHAKRWIIEDTEIHDVGCVNRGFGYDCLHFESAADATAPEGFKTFGIGLNVNAYTSDFEVRRNEVYRATKYGLNFDNEKNTCNGLLRNHQVADNHVRDIGAVGIFNHGTVGARIHGNTIENTTTWNEPPEMNGNLGPFGMSLGGNCTDDNEFYDNDILDSGGMGIMWNGSSDTITCSSPTSCARASAVGNRIYQNVLAGTCTERDASFTANPTFGYGSILVHVDSAGTLLLEDNELTDSRCRHSIQAYGPRDASVEPLELRVTGGSYESGPNATTRSDGNFYCGALHVYGTNRKLIVRDDTSIANITTKAIPKACVGYGATMVIDDVPYDPFADGPYTNPEDVGGPGGPATIVECSQTSHPDCD